MLAECMSQKEAETPHLLGTGCLGRVCPGPDGVGGRPPAPPESWGLTAYLFSEALLLVPKSLPTLS